MSFKHWFCVRCVGHQKEDLQLLFFYVNTVNFVLTQQQRLT